MTSNAVTIAALTLAVVFWACRAFGPVFSSSPVPLCDEGQEGLFRSRVCLGALGNDRRLFVVAIFDDFK